MKYSVDRIIDNICVLENIENKEKLEVDINMLPKEVMEGTILFFENDKYVIDNDTEEERRSMLRNRLDRLVGKKND